MTTFSPDGPHSPDLTRQAAEQAAEAIRFLNYATRDDAPGLQYPGDVYDLLGALYAGTQRLPQLLTQLAAFLAAQAASGTLADDQGREVSVVADYAGYRLRHAQGAASALTTALQQAQNAIAGLYVKDSTEGEGQADG